MDQNSRAIVGFHGKLPSRGDFVSRGLPQSFLGPWTAWMNDGLRSHPPSPEAAWLGAPAWHFALAPGFAGPLAAAGLFVPSVDRVGRQYPLTVAVVLPPCKATPNPESLEGWFAAAMVCARTALSESLAPDALFAMLDDDVDAMDAPGCADSAFWTLGGRLLMAGTEDSLRRTSAPLLHDRSPDGDDAPRPQP